MEATPVPESRSRERGAQERHLSPRIVALPTRPCTRTGILGYRRQRSAAEICRVIRHALDREVRFAKQTGVATPPDLLQDISAWIGRGYLP